METMNENTEYEPTGLEKRMLWLARIRTAAALLVLALMAAAVIIVVPDLVKTLGNVNEAAVKITEISSELSESAGELDELISSVQEMVDTNTQGVTDALEKVNSIDFDSLNSAIKDLSDVVAPLANLSNMLGRGN